MRGRLNYIDIRNLVVEEDDGQWPVSVFLWWEKSEIKYRSSFKLCSLYELFLEELDRQGGFMIPLFCPRRQGQNHLLLKNA